MAFTVPTFNLLCNIWTAGMGPPAAPRLANVACNLAWGRRVQTLTVGSGFVPMVLLLPAGTDVRFSRNATGPDTIECPAGTGRYYTVLAVDDLGKGFPNEHRGAAIEAITTFGLWPTPIP